MRLDNERPSSNIEDARGRGGGFGFPGGGGRRINIPMGGGRGGGLSIKTIIFLVVIYFVLKMLGIDLLQVLNGGGIPVPGGTTTQTDSGFETHQAAARQPMSAPTRNVISWRACWARRSASGTRNSSA